jgi:DNA segregation ATPase FtsK/SpoIIIE, S-DNA-T family
MARGRPRKKKTALFEHLEESTVRSVLTVIYAAVALFLLLSSASLAGVAGDFVFKWLTVLVGVGYFVLPVLLITLSVVLFKSGPPSVGITHLVGSIVFIVSALGLISMIGDGAGGKIGGLVIIPLISLFEVYSSFLILLVLLIISVLVILNSAFPVSPFSFIKKLFRKEKGLSDQDMELERETVFEGDYTEEQLEEDDKTGPDEETSETVEKRGVGKILDFAKGGSGQVRPIPVASITSGAYNPPPLSLLEKDRGKPGVGDIKASANVIRRTLQNFGVEVEVDEISIGPTVTRYAVKPAEGVRLSKIVSLANNLELALAAHPVRIEAPIPGRSLVGIEVPNSTKATVGLATLLSSENYQQSEKELYIALGKDISGHAHFADLTRMPHALVAGATGSGKSVAIHAIITSLLYRNSPESLRFIMIDPKRVELTMYNGTPHLLTPVITDPKKAILTLKWAAREMDRRYDILETESVRDVHSYHKNIFEPASANEEENLPEPLPYIVIVMDELADIMQLYPRELEAAIVRLAQMSRAVGIHLILSTQRPSVNVITGLIKANIPGRVAFQVSSQIDSRTILDSSGAEKLLGAGDMLYLSGDMSKPRRLQTAFISEGEVKKVVAFLRKQGGAPSEDLILTENDAPNELFSSLNDAGGDDEDELYDEAREIIVRAGRASTSYLQRKLRIGYARAARLMDMLEERGIIGPQEGSKAREILEGRDE